jgi:hypothetical protein
MTTITLNVRQLVIGYAHRPDFLHASSYAA